jgi:predicted metal-dependent hydrolase
MDRAEVRDLMERLERDAQRIAARFSLSYRSIEPERANVTSRYGICYSDGSIRIRLRHATSGGPLKYSSLVSTLCHELAHLRHFNHGERFQGFYRKLLRWAREEGIYQPRQLRRPQRQAGAVKRAPDIPEQLTLFNGLLEGDDTLAAEATPARKLRVGDCPGGW